MLEKMKLTVLLSISVLSTAVYSYTSAIQPVQAQAGMEKHFECPPHKKTPFANFLPYAIEGTCTVHSQDPAGDELIVVVTKKGGHLGTTQLRKGDLPFKITVHDNEKFSLGAQGGASLDMINNGAHTITADCTS
jgi:hypothetical protein